MYIYAYNMLNAHTMYRYGPCTVQETKCTGRIYTRQFQSIKILLHKDIPHPYYLTVSPNRAWFFFVAGVLACYYFSLQMPVILPSIHGFYSRESRTAENDCPFSGCPGIGNLGSMTGRYMRHVNVYLRSPKSPGVPIPFSPEGLTLGCKIWS
jgi:hypothetical protein